MPAYPDQHARNEVLELLQELAETSDTDHYVEVAPAEEHGWMDMNNHQIVLTWEGQEFLLSVNRIS